MESKLPYLSSTTDVRNVDKEAKDAGCETSYLFPQFNTARVDEETRC